MLIVVLLRANAPTQGRQLGSTGASDGLWMDEQSNTERLAQFTAQQGGTILFRIGRAFGIAKAGAVRRLDLPQVNSHCPYWSASLSHNGLYLAFLSSQQSGDCGISIYDLDSGSIRRLLNLPYAPWSLSWSWDDTKIAFTDPRSISPSAIKAVSTRDGRVDTLVESSRLATQNTPTGILFRFDGLAPLQWSHDGDELLVGFSRDVPTSHPNIYSSNPVEYRIELANGGCLSEFGEGYGATVSPIADRIAWYWKNKIVVANLDGTDRQVLTAAPRWMLFFPGDFKGPLVWSPDGQQLFFGTFESETCRDSVYLLQINKRRSKRLLQRTCLTIQDWR